MLGQSFLIGRAAKWIAEAFDVDEEDAKVIGLVAGTVTAIATFDWAGGAKNWSVETVGSQEAVEELRRRWLEDF